MTSLDREGAALPDSDGQKHEDRPLISVIIPCYNAAGTLALQLEALATQRDAVPFEVIVVDNRSTDGTADVAREWSGRVPGLRVVSAAAEQGTSYARNVGASCAAADLLMFCDGDDVVSAWWVALGAQAFEQADIWTGGADPIPENEYSSGVDTLREHMCDGDRLGHSAIMTPTRFPVLMGGDFGVTATLYRMLGGFDQSLPTAGEDNDFAVRAQLARTVIAHFPSIKIAYRAHAPSARRRRLIRRGARAHVLLATRFRLWEYSPHRHWILAFMKLALAHVRMALFPVRRDWPALRERSAAVVGLVHGVVQYRIARRIPSQRLGVGLLDGVSCGGIGVGAELRRIRTRDRLDSSHGAARSGGT